MCLIAWNWQPASTHPLLLIANRDEYYARPTAALHRWQDAEILAGRDLRSGGTWLGVSRSGRLAALTNYRDPAATRSDAPSRGELVSGFLQADSSALDYLTALRQRASDYNRFNLLVFDGQNLLGLESRHARIIPLPPGIGAVSNADFQTPWPKLAKLKTNLQRLLNQEPVSDAELLSLLQDRRVADDCDLPATGIALALERALAATFVTLPDYGTRCSSIVRFQPGGIEFLEQGFDAKGDLTGRRRITLPFKPHQTDPKTMHQPAPMTLPPRREFAPGLIIQGFTPPLKLDNFKLIAFDMDSTLINMECVDEIAAAVGRKEQVAAITEAAMQGQISDYKESLRQRVALLKGVSLSALDQIYRQRLRLNPGAIELVAACKKAGLKLLLVSGGFTHFTDRVRDQLGIDYTRSNVLEVEHGQLTGRIVDQAWGDICDGAEKRKMLLQTCAQLGIEPSQAIAVGDGANDLPMMDAAGLSVAFHAKPKVRQLANVSIESGGLDRLLCVLQA